MASRGTGERTGGSGVEEKRGHTALKSRLLSAGAGGLFGAEAFAVVAAAAGHFDMALVGWLEVERVGLSWVDDE